MSATTVERLERVVESLPGYAAWIEEQDRMFWFGVIHAGARKHLDTLPPCNGCGACERCALDEALAYTRPEGG